MPPTPSSSDYVEFPKALEISKNPNEPISFVDMVFIKKPTKEEYKKRIINMLGTKTSHNYIDKSWNELSNIGVEVINKSVIPYALWHIQRIFGQDIMELFQKDEKLKAFLNIAEKYNENPASRHLENRNYINNIDEFIDFFDSLLEEWHTKREERIRRMYKKELWNAIVGKVTIKSEFAEIEWTFKRFKRLIEDLYENLPTNIKNITRLEWRNKWIYESLEKILSKKNSNVMDALTDNFWFRFILLWENWSNEEAKKIILKNIKELITSNKLFSKKEKIILSNRWNFIPENIVDNIKKELISKKYEVDEDIQPKKKFLVGKIEWKFQDQNNPEDIYPYEIQIMDINGAKEDWRQSRCFFDPKKRIINYTPRSFTTIPFKKIKEYLRQWLEIQAKSFQKDQDDKTDKAESWILLAWESNLLDSRFWSTEIKDVETGDKYSIKFINHNTISINNTTFNLDEKELWLNNPLFIKIIDIYINHLIRENLMVPFFSKNKSKDESYYAPTNQLFIKHLSNMHKFNLEGAKIWCKYLVNTINSLEKSKQNSRIDLDEIDQEIVNKAKTLVESISKNSFNPKSSLDNFCFLYYYYDILEGGKILEKEHREYYKGKLKEKFNLW